MNYCGHVCATSVIQELDKRGEFFRSAIDMQWGNGWAKGQWTWFFYISSRDPPIKRKIFSKLLHQIHMFWTLRQALWPLFEFSEQVYCTQKWQLVILCTYYLPLLAQNTIKPNQVLPHFFIGREQRIEWDDGGSSRKTFSALSVFHLYLFDIIMSKNTKNAIFMTFYVLSGNSVTF